MADTMPAGAPGEGEAGGQKREEEEGLTLQTLLGRLQQSELVRRLVEEMRELERMVRTDALAGVGAIVLLGVLATPVVLYLVFVVATVLIGLTGFLCFEGIVVGFATMVLLVALFCIMMGATGVLLFVIYSFSFLKFLVECCRRINSFFNPWNTHRRVPAIQTIPPRAGRRQHVD